MNPYIEKLKQQIEILCDSIHAGRAAGEKGGGLTARWIQNEFEKMGLLKFGCSYAHGVLLGNGFYTIAHICQFSLIHFDLTGADS